MRERGVQAPLQFAVAELDGLRRLRVQEPAEGEGARGQRDRGEREARGCRRSRRRTVPRPPCPLRSVEPRRAGLSNVPHGVPSGPMVVARSWCRGENPRRCEERIRCPARSREIERDDHAGSGLLPLRATDVDCGFRDILSRESRRRAVFLLRKRAARTGVRSRRPVGFRRPDPARPLARPRRACPPGGQAWSVVPPRTARPRSIEDDLMNLSAVNEGPALHRAEPPFPSTSGRAPCR